MRIRKVRLRPLDAATGPLPERTHPAWRIVTGDEKVTWNTGKPYRREREPAFYERACDCALNCGRCNCFSRGGSV